MIAVVSFIGGVIVGVLLAILDSVRKEIPTTTRDWLRPQSGSVIPTKDIDEIVEEIIQA